MSDNKTWLWVLVASVVALAVGFGAAWAIQAQRVSTVRAEGAAERARLVTAKEELETARRMLETKERELAQAAAALDAAETTRTGMLPATTTPAPKPSGYTGKVACYIKKFSQSGSTTSVKIDQIQFLTGKAAAAAATARGDESPPPNDYYIVNDNPKLRTYPLAKSVKVTMTTAPDNLIAEGYPTTLATLMGAFDGSQPTLANAKGSPYWLTLKNGIVTAITEQYVP